MEKKQTWTTTNYWFICIYNKWVRNEHSYWKWTW